MGILDSIRGKIDEADKAYNPLRKVADTLENAGKKAPAPQPSPPAEAKTPQQRQYEAREKAMNRNNPHYNPVPRMKNVDNSGLTKEPIK